MRRISKGQKKRLTLKDIAENGVCPCSVCSSQDIKVNDNFDVIGKKNFVKLALSALEASNPSKVKH